MISCTEYIGHKIDSVLIELVMFVIVIDVSHSSTLDMQKLSLKEALKYD